MRDPMKSTAAPLRSDFADDPDMVELIELFVAEMPERVAELRRCIESGEVEQLGCIAHQLKGACGGYGFGVIGDAAASLERTIKQGEQSIDALRTEVDALVTLCSRAIA